MRRSVRKLLAAGLLLAILYLALYPLFIGAVIDREGAKSALLGLCPWLPRLYWTTPLLSRGISHIALFNLASPSGYASLLLLLLAVAFALLFIAWGVGSRVMRGRLLPGDMQWLLWTILSFTALFALIFLFAPAVSSQDIFLYGVYGRMVTVYHANPYVNSPAVLPHNLLRGLIPQEAGAAWYGPLWIDVTLPVTLLARDSIANIMIGFRLLGLAAHLVNTILIWAILTRVKPEARVSGTLLYAWNPLVLLLGVSEMHYDIFIVLFVLLASFFYQRNAFILSWISMLLAALLNIVCLLLFPFFACLLWKETRTLGWGRRSLWWLMLLGISGVIVVLAYYPYLPGWGIAGIATSIRAAFLPGNAGNSLDAAIRHLPVGPAVVFAWVASPLAWTILATVIVAGLVLFGLWLVDTLALALLFSSWIFLALSVLLPVNWPWYILLPLALAIASAGSRTLLLAILLTLGGALGYYFWLWPTPWPGQALVTVGLPLLIWGWTLFFTSTWRMTRADDSGQVPVVKAAGLSRPSRPSWPWRK